MRLHRILRTGVRSLLTVSWLIVPIQALPANGTAFPGWAFPTCVKPAPGEPNPSDAPLSVPGSNEHFSRQDLAQSSVIKDWFPRDHARLPAVISNSRPPARFACGYCHLPDGAGRPENAKLSGLPAGYIAAEVKSIQIGARQSAQADYAPSLFMREAVRNLTDDEIFAAADYFSKEKAQGFLRVLERDRIPSYQVACFVLKRTGHGNMPLKNAIVEMPDDFALFEARSPRTTYTAYVPPGSLLRGRSLAAGGRLPACASCHGIGLKGDPQQPGPPLAGRFATYLFRQLYAFQSGVRHDDAAAEMAPIVAQLSESEMIDLAAYAASLPP